MGEEKKPRRKRRQRRKRKEEAAESSAPLSSDSSPQEESEAEKVETISFSEAVLELKEKVEEPSQGEGDSPHEATTVSESTSGRGDAEQDEDASSLDPHSSSAEVGNKEGSKTIGGNPHMESTSHTQPPQGPNGPSSQGGGSGPSRNQKIVLGVLGALLLYLGWLWFVERVYVPPDHLLILNLKFGKANPDPENLRVVPEGYQGIQKVVLGEGRHFYNPLLYDREVRRGVIEVGIDEVGVVISRSGKPLPPGQFLTKKQEGEKGIWERVLTPGKWRLNPYAYKVEKYPIVKIWPGFVGCITAKSGKEPRENPADFLSEAFQIFQKLEYSFPEKEAELEKLFETLVAKYRHMVIAPHWLSGIAQKTLKRYWEVVRQIQVEELETRRKALEEELQSILAEAQKVLEKHFLEVVKHAEGWERYHLTKNLMRTYKLLALPVPEALKADFASRKKEYTQLIQEKLKEEQNSGRASRWLAEVKQFRRALTYAEKAFRGEILSKKGEKGIQEEVLQPGIYYINPHKYRVDIVEVGYRQFSLYDVRFPSKDGFPIKLDISVVWGLKPGDVPYLIKKYGNIQDIDQKIIRPQVENICKNFGSKYEAKMFIDGVTRKEFQQAFTAELSRVCRERRIDILLGLVRDIVVPQEVRRPIQEGKIAGLEKDMKEEQQKTQKVKNMLVELQEEVERGKRNIEAETRQIVENIDAQTKKLVAEIEAETQVQVAKIMREVARWEALRDQILGSAKAKVLEMLKTAEADKLRQNIRALGGARAYANYVFTQNLPKQFRVFLRYAGPGTFWTDLPKELKHLEKAAALKILEQANRDRRNVR